MTVQNTIVKNVYVGNGSTTVFPFTFECNKAEHIQAFVKDAAGNISSTTNFKVNLDQKNVTYPNTGEPLPDGYKLIILRQLPLQQLLNLLNQGPFYAEDIEETFDEVVMMLQQMTERIGRSLAVSIDIDAENSFNTIIPLEAGKTFRVKDDGTGFEVTEDPGKVIDGAKALLKLTTEQAEFAKEQADASSQSAVSAQNAAKEVKEIYGDGNFTPLSDLLGGLGTKLKRWGSIFANKVFASNLPIVYNSVAEMKADTILWEGMNTKTLGYYAPNDGGGASYLIRAKADSDVDNGGSLHELANGLVAELIVENGTVCPEQFGAKGDGVTEDTSAIQNAINTGKIVYFNNTYLSNRLKISSNTTLIGKGTIISNEIYSLISNIENIENVKINGLTFIGKGYWTGLTLSGLNNDVCIRINNAKNIVIANCVFKNYGGIAISIIGENIVLKHNNIFSNVVYSGTLPNYSFGINFSATNIIIDGNTIKGYIQGIISGLDNKNVCIVNNYISSKYQHCLYMEGGEDYIVNNNIINATDGICGVKFQYYGSEEITLKNINIQNNIIYGGIGGQGILVTSLKADYIISDVIIDGNNIISSGRGVEIQNVDKCKIADNNINSSDYGVRITGDSRAIFIDNNRIISQNGIWTEDTDLPNLELDIHNNRITLNQGTSAAIKIYYGNCYIRNNILDCYDGLTSIDGIYVLRGTSTGIYLLDNITKKFRWGLRVLPGVTVTQANNIWNTHTGD